MAISLKLKQYLDNKGLHYDLVTHKPTSSSMESAQAAHIPGDKLAKSVVLKDDQAYLMAIIPATYHVEFDELADQLNRHLELVPENEIATIFTDCDVGAIPPAGDLYAIDMITDEKLMRQKDIYFESGDHTHLIHMKNQDFKQLVKNSTFSEFASHV